MNQTKLESSVEATANIATGFCISFAVWVLVVPMIWGANVTTQDPGVAFWLTGVFTVSSWLRSYIWRRVFNRGFYRSIIRRTK